MPIIHTFYKTRCNDCIYWDKEDNTAVASLKLAPCRRHPERIEKKHDDWCGDGIDVMAFESKYVYDTKDLWDKVPCKNP